jgi:2-keto-4-pentenoate hydratase/2-oxohepta-3-ene-1,7-dioic acid hydratase in catechol pathway
MRSPLVSGQVAAGLIATAMTAMMATGPIASAQDAMTKYVRYNLNDEVSFGILNGTTIATLDGDPIMGAAPTGKTVALDSVKLLPPSDAGKVFAVGMNFASHISSASDRPPPLFLKLPTSLTGSGSDVGLPPDANNVHFEGELVLIIGKQAKNVSEADAMDYVFGLTAGNDLTERSWQGRDLQWMRAKAADGFGPVGPAMVTGLDANNVLLTTRLNGEIVQQENTRNMIHKPAKVVAYLSRYFTLKPGDMIFMGTPGRTSSLDDGDVVTVTIGGIGTLSNKIVR